MTANFPAAEQFGLTNQMRRASVSIPSNIAEGHSRKASADFIRFLRIALGSTTELETQLLIAQNLDYLDKDTGNKLTEKCISIQKMTRRLIKSLET